MTVVWRLLTAAALAAAVACVVPASAARVTLVSASLFSETVTVSGQVPVSGTDVFGGPAGADLGAYASAAFGQRWVEQRGQWVLTGNQAARLAAPASGGDWSWASVNVAMVPPVGSGSVEVTVASGAGFDVGYVLAASADGRTLLVASYSSAANGSLAIQRVVDGVATNLVRKTAIKKFGTLTVRVTRTAAGVVTVSLGGVSPSGSDVTVSTTLSAADRQLLSSASTVGLYSGGDVVSTFAKFTWIPA